MNFEKNTFDRRLKSMLKVDCRRMFMTRLFYIMAGICLIAPILILVMTTMMDGTVSVDPKTGEETVIEGFKNVWQIIGTVSSDNAQDAGMEMSMTAMCNMNLLYFGLAVLVGIFISGDFKSGYSKNLFTVRARKSDYVCSKIIVCTMAAMMLVMAFFAGSMLGGAAAGLPFDFEGFDTVNIVMCLLSKLILTGVFVPIYTTISVCAKEKTWLCIMGGCAAGALMFMMIPMITPLDATIMNAALCAAGGGMFCFGLGAVSDILLRKSDLV